MRERALAEHTYELRVKDVERVLAGSETSARAVSANGCSVGEWIEDCYLWIVDHFFVGKWPRDHLPRALQALHERGHEIVFYEHDLEWYASNRDMPEPPFCRVRLFDEWSNVRGEVKKELSEADVAVVGSYFPDGLAAIEEVGNSSVPVKAFYDIDTPITVAQLREHGGSDYLRADQIPEFDLYFSFTGGPMLAELEQRFGARKAVPLYCSFDPKEYRRFGVNKRFACDLSYMGTYAPDRQPKIDEPALRAGPAIAAT